MNNLNDNPYLRERDELLAHLVDDGLIAGEVGEVFERECCVCGRMMSSETPIVRVQSEQTGFALELHTACAKGLAEALRVISVRGEGGGDGE